MSDPPLSVIDFKHKMAWILTILNKILHLTTELTKPIKRTFYQSSEFLMSLSMLSSLWKMFNLFPLPDLVTLKGNNRHRLQSCW